MVRRVPEARFCICLALCPLRPLWLKIPRLYDVRRCFRCPLWFLTELMVER
jgi:hypothetical protein